MLRIVKLLVLFMVTQPLFSEIVWQNSMTRSLEIAKEKQLPIILDIYTDWCYYCKILEANVFPSYEVKQELEKFVAVRLNAERFPTLMRKYNVRGFPTILILDKDGNLIDKITGLPSKQMIINKMRVAYKKRDVESALLDSWRKDPDSVVNNFKLGVFYYEAGKLEQSVSYFQRTYNSSRNESPELKHDSMYNVGIIKIKNENYYEAIPVWTRYLETYPNRDIMWAHYYRGISYLNTGKKKDAKDDLLKARELTDNAAEKYKIQSILDELEVY
ncbi:MAG: thioredoxin fold domain-containing protein [Leptospiraceae bacterium]|nr:thioredoxin fold domain-containing protein [Leptospiraceae bacterium]